MKHDIEKSKRIFKLILFLVFVSIIISFPKNLKINFTIGKLKINQTFSSPSINLHLGNLSFQRDLEIKKGLDLAGGAHLVFEANMKNVKAGDRQKAIDAVKNVIERRINLFGVSEPNIQTAVAGDKFKVIAELPGVNDTEEAIALIGKTAQLNFRLEEASPSAKLAAIYGPFTKKTKLTGQHLQRTDVVFNQTTGNPEVSLEFNSDGSALFADITKNNIGKRLAIFLDDELVSAPQIQTAILQGNAVISGSFTIEEARRLSTQLNAGALPVPIKVVEQKTVSATLGSDSVEKSLKAGVIGLGLVVLFMIAYYGRLGLIASFCLIIYGLLSLMLYKLIPITLTLPGIAGFILSIGMAVDSNILIFERYKEESKKTTNLLQAMELAFGRAWDSIKDANLTTLLVCFILFNPFNWNFLNISGMIRGFALNLALGVLTSLFTGIVVTRTFIRLFYFRHKKI